MATEHIIYPRVLGWFAQRRLQWHDGAAWLDGTRLDDADRGGFPCTQRSEATHRAGAPARSRWPQPLLALGAAGGAAADELKPYRGLLQRHLARHDGGGSNLKLEKTGDTWTYTSKSEARGIGRCRLGLAPDQMSVRAR